MNTHNQQPAFNHISKSVIAIIFIISSISILGIVFPYMYDVFTFHGAFFPQTFKNSEFYRLVTYALFHNDYGHLGMNMLWLLIFATPIQRFFGTVSFLIIFLCGVIAGGLVFLTYDNHSILVGASAGVSACGGASLRFMLKPAMDFYGRPQLYKLTDGRFLMPSFLFFFTDIIYAFFMNNTGQNIAWQSHTIGFIIGVLLMELTFINKGAMKRPKLTPSEDVYLGD